MNLGMSNLRDVFHTLAFNNSSLRIPYKDSKVKLIYKIIVNKISPEFLQIRKSNLSPFPYEHNKVTIL